MTTKTGVVAGSFDPITNGHLWLIREALNAVDVLFVTIGHNPTKKYYFTSDERERQVRMVLSEVLPAADYDRVWIGHSGDLLVEYAHMVGADYIIRGIRNSTDFLYEQQIQAVNAKIRPTIGTLYFIPPSDYLEVSSSTVRGLVGFAGWENIVSQYVHPIVIDDFRNRVSNK